MTSLVVARYSGDAMPQPEDPPAAGSIGVFQVLRGEGDWAVIAEVEGDAEAMERVLARGAVNCELFNELFRASDARPIAESADHVYLVRIDVDSSLVDNPEFEAWYNRKHVPDVATAGLLRGRRFKNGLEAWQYLASYDMAHEDVLESDELARIRGFEHFTPLVRGIERTVLRRVRQND